MRKKGDVAQYKKAIVSNLVHLFKEYPIVGAVNMENLPAKQLQNIRKSLQGKVELAITKKRYIKIAITQTNNKDFENLVPYLKGMPALLFTKEDPFILAKILNKNKSKAPIKAGQIAPHDIEIKAGPTSFAPGPVIGELGSLGVKTSIEAGKIAIVKDTVVVKEGQEVNSKAASILLRLGIEPMEIGLNLTGVLENGNILTPDILFIDEQEYIDKIAQAHSMAATLALEICYVTKDNIKLLLSKAHNNANSLAVKAKIITKETVKPMLSKADNEAKALKSLIEEV